jgi:cell division protein FtsB
MASFGKKKTITEYLYTKPVIFVLLLVCIFLSVSVYNRYAVEREMSLRRTEAQEKKQELLERKKTLEERVNYLGGDRGIEEEIRTHFDVAKEGEKVFILTGEEKKEVQEVVPLVEERPWYKFW